MTDDDSRIFAFTKDGEMIGDLADYRTPFEERAENAGATPRLVGGVDLTIGKKPQNNAVSLPNDKQYQQKLRKDKTIKTDFYDKRGQEVLEKLNKIG